MTRVSAIVTSYNVEAYIATAMQSLIDSEFEDLELIVVDDGSTDLTRDVSDLVGNAAPRNRVTYVPVYFSQNTIGGVACAANAGLDRASGEIVVFVDGDDWVIPRQLKQAVQQLQESKADFLVCDCKEYWNKSGAYTNYPEGHLWEKIKQCGGLRERRDIALQMAPFPWRKIYRRSFLEKESIRFPVGDYFFEDNPFHWEVLVKAELFDIFESVTHVHRMDRLGQTVTGMGVKPLRIFEHAKTIRAMLEREKLFEETRENYFQWLIEHIFWCCRNVAPRGFNELFDLSAKFLYELTQDELFCLLADRERSFLEVQQLTAIILQERMSFLQLAPSQKHLPD